MPASGLTPFKALFGVDEQEIKTRCILMPISVPAVLSSWQVTRMSRGVLYQVGQAKNFTLIHTRMGAGLVGDAVLYLRQTPCRELFLFGSCGLIGKEESNGLGLGSCVIPACAYSLDSFSELLLDEQLFSCFSRRPCFCPDEQFRKRFLNHSAPTDFNLAVCATVSSLKLEEEKLPLFRQAGLDIVDMECSAFLAAAQAVGIPALPLFWISDIVTCQPFYYALVPEQKQQMTQAMLKIAGLLAAYCSNQES